jgi:50S ribosomal protein L16 3-hydroxylase
MALFTKLLCSEKDQQSFIRTIWQQQPLFIKGALKELGGDLLNVVDGATLADLAFEAEVESRIISGQGIDGDWTCEHGPLKEDNFTQLPDKNWTLLVQGVDQWSEDLSGILDLFNFLPRWRLEDIMASYAPIGGGVGPHFDYYDVFLLQISGTRQWQLGQHCNDDTPLQDNDHVKLLSEFEVKDTYNAKPGDILYIPAGVAHWGTALSDDCITLSVGFRAPSQRELLVATLGSFFEEMADSFSEQQRYQDTADSIDEHPAKINQAVHQQLTQYLSALTPEMLQQSINQAFGQLVTEPRYTAIEEDDDKQDYVKIILQQLKEEKKIELQHPIHSRFAFSEAQLFVNGEAFTVSEDFAKGVCEGRVNDGISDNELVYLVELLERGDVELG